MSNAMTFDRTQIQGIYDKIVQGQADVEGVLESLSRQARSLSESGMSGTKAKDAFNDSLDKSIKSLKDSTETLEHLGRRCKLLMDQVEESDNMMASAMQVK